MVSDEILNTKPLSDFNTQRGLTDLSSPAVLYNIPYFQAPFQMFSSKF